MHHKPELPTQEGVERLNREGGGLLRLEIIRPEDLFALSCSVFQGNGGAFKRLMAAADSSAKIKRQARKNPVVCLCCPRAVRDPDAVLTILIPAMDSPTVAIASALCPRCGAEPDETITARASAAYVKAWPGLRCVEVTHPEGGNA